MSFLRTIRNARLQNENLRANFQPEDSNLFAYAPLDNPTPAYSPPSNYLSPVAPNNFRGSAVIAPAQTATPAAPAPAPAPLPAPTPAPLPAPATTPTSTSSPSPAQGTSWLQMLNGAGNPFPNFQAFTSGLNQFRDSRSNWLNQRPQMTEGMTPEQYRDAVFAWRETRPTFGGQYNSGDNLMSGAMPSFSASMTPQVADQFSSNQQTAQSFYKTHGFYPGG